MKAESQENTRKSWKLTQGVREVMREAGEKNGLRCEEERDPGAREFKTGGSL